MIGFQNDAPVVIFGMHRSGTTIVGDILQAHGVFSGAQQDVNGEAVLFQALNAWMFTTSGASWDNPAAMINLLRDTDCLELTDAYLRRILSGPLRGRYLGWSALMGQRSGLRKAYRTWGWKDPRNTFTLPIWENIYPNARYIYVERHGVDVAHSLVTRRHREMDGYRRKFDQYPFIYGMRMKRGGFSDSMRSSTMEHAFGIWEEYVAEGRAHVARLGPARVASVNFEDLCATPRDTVGKLLELLELGDAKQVKQDAIAKLKPERALAHRRDQELSKFAESHADRLNEPLAKSLHAHSQLAFS
ncbi:sulfotransferase [Martelella limonii]|uniref:sulfotransferase n=1 Tax=Martelella limonii TaxID=1647649 RepID=UPI0015803522|nr:sulfotransferase [Martelella limonii]